MGARIVIVDSSHLREEVYRFRYDVYVREMQRQGDADHERRRLVDALDATGTLLAALDPAGRVVGTLRANMFHEPAAREYERLYELELTVAERRVCSLTTRMMLARAYRGTGLALSLARARFKIVVESDIARDYMDCNDHLVPFFSRLGYRRERCVVHPDYGEVTVMMCPMDLARFAAMRSPLLGDSDVNAIERERLPSTR